MYRMRGTGLPNVHLFNGYFVEGDGESETVSYSDLDGLYRRIGQSIAERVAPMSGAELRFLRKRMGASQSEIGHRLGKTAQAVAKWEKGSTAIPTADGFMVRVLWLYRFAQQAILKSVAKADSAVEPLICDYFFEFIGSRWQDVSGRRAVQVAAVAAQMSAEILGKVQATTIGSTLPADSTARFPLQTWNVERLVL